MAPQDASWAGLSFMLIHLKAGLAKRDQDVPHTRPGQTALVCTISHECYALLARGLALPIR